jgi:hydroxyacylglutathione hydrolase
MISLTVKSLPVLTDNFIHVLVKDSSAAVIDPAEADAVVQFLKSHNLNLSHILITHHHADHTGGVKELTSLYPKTEVIGFLGDRHRLPPLSQTVTDGSQITVIGIDFDVWQLPGHTTGHIAFISTNQHIAFTGDVLFGMGCGRVFEGTYEDMFRSLQRLKTLTPQTKVFCTHEYTVNNGRFCETILPNHDAIKERLKNCLTIREKGEFTVPLTLSEELNTNPFLFAENLQQFSHYRDARNRF